MTTYTLKLVSGVNYNLYNGATLVSDADLATLFGSAGSAFFVFDFDGGTPTNTTDLTIVDSNSQAVITNTGLSGIAENTNFNGDWSASATAFDTFVKSPAAVLDEAQMSDLMGKIKSAGGLSPSTTFWGQTASGGAVQGILTVDGASSAYQFKIGGGYQSSSDNRITRSSSGIDIYASSMFNVMRGGNVRLKIDSNSTRIAGGPLRMTNSSSTSTVGGQIKQMADPTEAQDAATKNYVDSIYPVGTVFTSTSATAPTIAGGTWTEIGTQTIGSSTVHYYERTA